MYMRHREEEGSYETKEEEMVPCFRLPYLWESEFCVQTGVWEWLECWYSPSKFCIEWAFCDQVGERFLWLQALSMEGNQETRFRAFWRLYLQILVLSGSPAFECMSSMGFPASWVHEMLCLVRQQKPWIALCPEAWAEILMVASHPIYFSYLGHISILEGKSRQWLVNCKKFWFGEMSLSFKLTWQLLALPQLCPVAVSSNHKLLTQNWVWEVYYVVELYGK
jgi:hypothetical protein